MHKTKLSATAFYIFFLTPKRPRGIAPFMVSYTMQLMTTEGEATDLHDIGRCLFPLSIFNCNR